MPRLSNQHYLEIHDFLRWAWEHCQDLFGTVPTQQQWEVHEFFQPSKQLNDQQILDHRQAITKSKPSLPAKAGKSASRMLHIFEAAEHRAKGDLKLRDRLILQAMAWADSTPDARGTVTRIAPIARPEPDVDKIVLALMSMVDEMERKDETA